MHPISQQRWLGWAVGVCAAVVVMSFVVVIYYALHADSRRVESQIEACERGNLVRATVNDLLDHVYPEAQRLRILNCQEIIK
jgi:hypothetical protein